MSLIYPDTTEESTTEIEAYFDRLWPLFRSLTGDGVRQTHQILSEIIPFERIEIASGTAVFDWNIPKEWIINEAYIIAPSGEKILDIKTNNLHLVNPSIPFQGQLSWQELDQHLHSLPDMPEAIPYVTSYYQDRWGFCLSHQQRQQLPKEGQYQVFIDSKLIDGSMTLSHLLLEGETDQEILISTYTCHPSMANNELSGPLVAAFLYRRLASLAKRKYTYRFVFCPETIGSIAYLSLYGKQMKEKMVAGYVVTCIGQDKHFSYKYSRQENSMADQAAQIILRDRFQNDWKPLGFGPTGSDERQYCSPGFNLPVGSLIRTPYGAFPEYHTSLDNKQLISFDALKESIDVYFDICMAMENNHKYQNLMPFGEPQLGKRGLCSTLGANKQTEDYLIAMKWLLNLSDGDHDLFQIAQRSHSPFHLLLESARR